MITMKRKGEWKRGLMNKICDLHVHSVFSDGSYTPRQLVDEAVARGIAALALCDHNTVDGIPDFLEAACGKPIKAASGAEFSVEYEDTELHLLGLFIPQKHLSDVNALMREVAARKEQSNVALVEALRRDGILLDYEKIKASTPKGRVNRANIALALTEKGYTASVQAAFSGLLSPAAGYYKEPKRLTLFEMLDFISAIGAVSVLAHPFLNLSAERLAVLLPEARARGLVGMECLYSLYDAETTRQALALADRFGLKPSGGSDFHGAAKPDIALGVGRGELRVPYAWYLALQQG